MIIIVINGNCVNKQVHLFELIIFILIHLIVLSVNDKNVHISELLFEVLLIVND